MREAGGERDEGKLGGEKRVAGVKSFTVPPSHSLSLPSSVRSSVPSLALPDDGGGDDDNNWLSSGGKIRSQ